MSGRNYVLLQQHHGGPPKTHAENGEREASQCLSKKNANTASMETLSLTACFAQATFSIRAVVLETNLAFGVYHRSRASVTVSRILRMMQRPPRAAAVHHTAQEYVLSRSIYVSLTMREVDDPSSSSVCATFIFLLPQNASHTMLERGL